MASPRELSRSLIKAFETGDEDMIDELIAPETIDHSPFPGQASGKEGVKQILKIFSESFSDTHWDILEEVEEGDTVTVRTVFHGTHTGPFLGIPATGKKVSVEAIDITRWENGKAVEHWGLQDSGSMMMQLGVMPGQS